MRYFLFYFRLFKAFAEEQAIEDAIYYLGEALRKNVIELEVFLKVRACFILLEVFYNETKITLFLTFY